MQSSTAIGLQRLDTFLRRNRRLAESWAMPILRNRAWAEDAVQAAAVKAMKAIARGVYKEQSDFPAWFRPFVVRAALNFRDIDEHFTRYTPLEHIEKAPSRRDEEEPLTINDVLADPVNAIDAMLAEDPEPLRLVRWALAQLSEEKRNLLIQEYGNRGSRLLRTPPTANQRQILSRTMRQVRQMVNG